MKVLVVEDEKTIQKLLGEVLKLESYKVVFASDGEEGIKLAKYENPNLIILDVVLPKINGWEVAKIVKKDPATSNIPILF